jgi:hypothetical protein
MYLLIPILQLPHLIHVLLYYSAKGQGMIMTYMCLLLFYGGASMMEYRYLAVPLYCDNPFGIHKHRHTTVQSRYPSYNDTIYNLKQQLLQTTHKVLRRVEHDEKHGPPPSTLQESITLASITHSSFVLRHLKMELNDAS